MTHILQDKTILSIEVSKDREHITFTTTTVGITAGCYADCCSETWIEHVELPALGFPAKVLEVVTLDLSEKDGPDDRQGHCSYYGLKIITDKGEIIIDFRNSSNGYYGGDLYFPKESFYKASS